MILQGNLGIKYKGESYGLRVKTILKNGIYYFFVSDKEQNKSLLAGETLELVYTDFFRQAEKKRLANFENTPDDIISAIKNMLLENKQLWFY